jgi:translation initiation factor 1
MRPEKAKRVDVNPAQSGLAGLGNALAGLNLGPLPPAPPEPAVAPAKSAPPAKPRQRGRVILRRETAHRGGKTVIVIHDFPTSIPLSELEALAKSLRHALGTGGALKDRTIEIQGDHPAKIRAHLEREGYQVAGV